ncbi:Ribosomal RNA large subunit methyltransferase G [Vibrio aerogenes CECT 7868]|uniref:Ribosomal RNA large subunit methyltransferase G n=1 Tax=Vibrio aerogenes CECT 7868 TaxID=1216006 RepID=A0A1M5WKD9_9VIBR|nr:methyltransferase [Vibrio aerogenes]SHH87941.1 Ribosomal RNA large subunit methyltransferase G [Vibrio aerogenes CECT 7868]
MKNELQFSDRTLKLSRYPYRSNDSLQAWDAGDEYIIRYTEEEMSLLPDQKILILNDHFGALSCWFSQHHQVTTMSDSFLSHQGIRRNLEENDCPSVRLLTTMDSLPQHIDFVLLKLPKINRHLIWQLIQIRQNLSPDCQVIAVNKAREIHTSTLRLFEKYLGHTTTSLAWKKHRLIFSAPDVSTHHPDQTQELTWPVEGESIHLINLPNVYSGEKLDLGARFFLTHLPQDPKFKHIIDLGCGNGVLAVKARQLNPQAAITCIDESFMAVESARQNLQHHFSDCENIRCIANNCLDEFKGNSADLVLCNPPFHQQTAITDHIAWQMFCDAKHVLNKGGQLLVIGNRHLGYDGKLTRIFGKTSVKTVAANKKFVILQATKG